MPYPTIQTLPPAPQRGEDFQTFADKANAHAAALTPWTDDVNSAGAFIESTAAGVDEDRQAAAQSVSDAAAARDKSQEWAESDTAPAVGSKSSKAWASDAEGFAQSASDDADRAESAVATLPEGTIADGVVAPDNAWSSEKITQNLAEGGFTRYDLESVATTATLDLAASNVFRVDASSPVTLAFANAPSADRAMTVVVHIAGNSAVTWPAGIDWDSDTAPELGDNETKVVLFWDGVEWSGFVRVAK